MKNFILLIPRIFYFLYQIFLGLFDPNIPYKVKFIILAAIFYIFYPNDFIKDFIPILGQIDDIIVLGITASIYKYFSFINNFKKEFEKKKNNQNNEKIIDGKFRTVEDDEEKIK